MGHPAGIIIIYFFSHACGIFNEDDKTYIITGGNGENGQIKLVRKYTQDGDIEDLPSLNQDRAWHGCGTYIDSNFNRVSCTV